MSETTGPSVTTVGSPAGKASWSDLLKGLKYAAFAAGALAGLELAQYALQALTDYQAQDAKAWWAIPAMAVARLVVSWLTDTRATLVKPS